MTARDVLPLALRASIGLFVGATSLVGQQRPPATTTDPCCTVVSVNASTGEAVGVVTATGKRFTILAPPKSTDMRTTGTVKWFVGQKLWMFAAQGKIGLTPADPCCDIRFLLR